MEYFPLPFLFFRAFRSTKQGVLYRYYFIFGIIASLLYAVSDEIHQSFTAMRDPSFFDFLADSGGVLIGGFLLRPVIRDP